VLPVVAAARAQREAALLNLRRTEVRAPTAGRISQADRLHIGQTWSAGLPVLTIVANGQSYVEANFKETDLADMRVGQRAEVEFDAYPGLKLKGQVASIGAGTAASSRCSPRRTPTGNWVKVTQRVPVADRDRRGRPRQLIAGLSTDVTVFTFHRGRR
jgi:membrane fusion protein (multidrug efflux system)